MNKKGYGVMSIKKEVIEEIKSKAKEEKKTISDFLSDVIKQHYSNKEERGYSNDIATDIKEIKGGLKKLTYSNSIAIGEKKEVKVDKREEIKETKKEGKDIPIQKKEIENKEVTDKYSRFKPFESTKKEKVIPARPL